MTAGLSARLLGESSNPMASTPTRPPRHSTRCSAGAARPDWNRPVMDVLQFLVALRKEFGPDNPPVVFCTTENDMSHIEAAIECGAQEYIMKPFDEDILTGKLAQVGVL